MRIVVLGDFHLAKDRMEISEAAMADVKACKPDLVVPLGDFGASGRIGTPAGIEESYELLRRIDAPMRPVLGNHDLQRESGAGTQAPGTMSDLLLERFGLDAPYGVIERDDLRLVFIGTEYQSPDICYQLQECYATDEQYLAIESILTRRPGVPVIVFSHAPPLGCGLRTVPATHVRATNAYLSQNHEPLRWLQLAERFPEVVMWFSAHYHLGHVYQDSQAERYGTWFFTTAVHGPSTRDGYRQSRVIDVEEDAVFVRTLCHEARGLDDRFEWSREAPMKTLVGARRIAGKELQWGILRGVGYDSGGSGLVPSLPTCVQSVPVVGASPVADGLASLPGGNVLLATEDGFAWEVEMQSQSVLGTHHLGERTTFVCASADAVWRTWGAKAAWSDARDLWRFVRSKDGMAEKECVEFPVAVTALAPQGDGSAWVACGRDLSLIGVADTAFPANPAPKPFATLPAPIRSVAASDAVDAVWVVDEQHVLRRVDVLTGRIDDVATGVLAWDFWAGEGARVVRRDGRTWLVRETGDGRQECVLPGAELSGPVHVSVLCLRKGRTAAIVDGTLYYWDQGADELQELGTGGHARALRRAEKGGVFTVAVSFADWERHTEIQRWRLDHTSGACEAVYAAAAPPGVTLSVSMEVEQTDQSDQTGLEWSGNGVTARVEGSGDVQRVILSWSDSPKRSEAAGLGPKVTAVDIRPGAKEG